MATQVAVEVAKFSKDVQASVRVSDAKAIPEPLDAQGIYPGFQPKSLPATPGLEGMGVVEKLGPKAKQLSVGQRVVVAPHVKENGQGTWQEYLVLPEERAVPVPDDVSDEDAAQFAVNSVTAFCLIELVPKGKWLVHNAANSVLGKALIPMARHMGVKTINLVRRAEAAEDLKKLRPDAVINISEEGLDLPKQIREITGGEGAWAAFNPVAGSINADIMRSLRDGGSCYIYGLINGMTVESPIPDVLFRGVECKGFWLSQYLESLPPKEKQRIMTSVMGMLSKGVFSMEPASHKLPLQNISEALKAYEKSAGKGGKVLLEG